MLISSCSLGEYLEGEATSQVGTQILNFSSRHIFSLSTALTYIDRFQPT